MTRRVEMIQFITQFHNHLVIHQMTLSLLHLSCCLLYLWLVCGLHQNLKTHVVLDNLCFYGWIWKMLRFVLELGKQDLIVEFDFNTSFLAWKICSFRVFLCFSQILPCFPTEYIWKNLSLQKCILKFLTNFLSEMH